MYRVGLGHDSHRITKKTKKPLMLGGVKIKHQDGLEGNSDSDVILHSLCNALSSAIGGDSIGTWSDEMYQKGTEDSAKYVAQIFSKVRKKKYVIENVSISVEMKEPYLSFNQIELIKNNIGKLIKATPNKVGLTINSGEGLTSFGRGEGVQVFTVVLLKKNDT
ncbi:2-C-methyl-D-erythritol 2,4-cyclodiphosphate synthase [Candidatus Roizmanbacteria bacterium]|nr:2-C-methyl-D-erythritol 2,4-cyclodiphosphate synthase [Candidatus Roizmanbacteria bacterium]